MFSCNIFNFKSLTTISLSWLGGQEVTHPPWVQVVPGSNPESGTDFYVKFLYFAVVAVLRFVIFCNSFCNVNSFSTLNILQSMRLFILFSKYFDDITPNILDLTHDNALGKFSGKYWDSICTGLLRKISNLPDVVQQPKRIICQA